jgi:hypothetical protein
MLSEIFVEPAAQTMAQDHTIMASRYELKYLIPHSMALRVREFVQQYLELDEFGVGMPNLSYPVHSLYYDTEDWKIYWRTINGDKNRFKLRVRFYNDSPKTPVFWEIKRRMKDVILKQRCGVKRPSAIAVIAGQLPSAAEMIAPNDASELRAIEDFLHLQCDLNAYPRMHVAYVREAYVNNFNNEVRLTFDRHVRVEPCSGVLLTTKMKDPFVCTGVGDDPDDVVILELKFSGRFPNWYRDLVVSFNLMQSGASKYLEGTMMHAGRNLEAKDVIRNMIL